MADGGVGRARNGRDGDAGRRAVEAVFRIERARLIAGLARLAGDVDRAEELAQEALVAALDAWPAAGVPRNPGAWLMAAAKRRGIDGLRHERMRRAKAPAIRAMIEDGAAERDAADAMAAEDDIGDPLLAMIFVACHPVLSPPMRAALTLRLVGGLGTGEIARAFLASEPAIAQRIVRAKQAIRAAGLRFEVPRGPERDARLGSVLEVVYLIFTEGHAATGGTALTRPDLCAEAQRLARILAGLMPEAPEVLGLLALVELQASRLGARVAADGSAVALPAQDRRRWDRLLIRRGLAALARAEACVAALGEAAGPYALQAAIAACHARAASAEDTDWRRIAGLYDALAERVPSPVVALARAVAHGMAFGPGQGLALIAEVEATGALDRYAPLPAAAGDCLLRLGRVAEARAAFERAAAVSGNVRERDFLLARACAIGG